MLNLAAPFETFYRDHPDHNAVDSRRETEQLFERQKLIDDLLSGRIPTEQLLELLFEQGIEPTAYVDAAIDNVDHIISTGAAVDPDEVKLILPLSLCPGNR